MKQRIFKAGVLSEHLINRYKLSNAACNFSFNLISGDFFNKVYSVLPLYVGGEMVSDAFEDKRYELIYSRLRKCKGILRKIASLFEQYTIFRQIESNSIIWYYNMNTLSVLLYILLKIFKPTVQNNIIVLDFTPPKKWYNLNSFYLKIINNAHGRICLADSSLFNHENCIILPGVVPLSKVLYPIIEKPTPSFLLSGVLSENISQTKMVLDAFIQCPECELHITGSGPDQSLAEDYSRKYSNIHFHGKIPFSEYLDLLHLVTFQLSTRKPSAPENQNNFPSKILESLLHNRAVISTIHYKQLGSNKVIECNNDTNGLLDCIKKLESFSYSQLGPFINQGNQLVKQFSTEKWLQFMEQIENN